MISGTHRLSVHSLLTTPGGCAISSSVRRICHGLLLVHHLASAIGFASEGELSLGSDRVRSRLLQEADVLLAFLRRKRSLFCCSLDGLRNDASGMFWSDV
jgi:hypothetical protein